MGSATVVPIQITGDPAKRFSMVVLGDGYTAAEMPQFRAHLDKHLNVLWSIEPFRSYRNYINVYAVEIVSAESGITCDPESPRAAEHAARHAVRRRLHQHQCPRHHARSDKQALIARSTPRKRRRISIRF